MNGTACEMEVSVPEYMFNLTLILDAMLAGVPSGVAMPC